MMDQALVNWLLAGFGGLIGFLLNVVWLLQRGMRIAQSPALCMPQAQDRRQCGKTG